MKEVRKLEITYGRDNTKQTKMLYLHCGLSRQEQF